MTELLPVRPVHRPPEAASAPGVRHRSCTRLERAALDVTAAQELAGLDEALVGTLLFDHADLLPDAARFRGVPIADGMGYLITKHTPLVKFLWKSCYRSRTAARNCSPRSSKFLNWP